jgi:hypothetical protein
MSCVLHGPAACKQRSTRALVHTTQSQRLQLWLSSFAQQLLHVNTITCMGFRHLVKRLSVDALKKQCGHMQQAQRQSAT